MQRRRFTNALLAAAGALLASGSRAAGVSDADAASGIRAALERGAGAAVDLLGRTDGFLGNPKVRIPLPGFLKDAAKLRQADRPAEAGRRPGHGDEPRRRSGGAGGEERCSCRR